MRIRGVVRLSAVVAVALGAPLRPLWGQDLHIPLPLDSIEYLLSSAPFELPADLTGTRFQNDRTQRVDLAFSDGTTILTKWAAAPQGGEAFNNVPRYEVAAYEISRLFLDDAEAVVPPTVMRAVPLDWYRTLTRNVDPTFRGTRSVVVVLQSFIQFVTTENVWDEKRFQADTAYARNWANANLLTYLIRHSDSNTGNLLIASIGTNPRIFSVDNGVAFNSIDSDRGTRWRSLLVDRFPARTVARLRTLTEDQVRRRLEVLAQWRVEDDQLVPMEPTANTQSRDGVRQRNGVVQFGLNGDEIDDVWYRLQTFLREVDGGRYHTF